MKTTLVIMAAGLGSRYGGNKQTEGIGPNHEMLMEYSIFDAVRAGFSKFVFVIKPDMKPLIESLCGELVSACKDQDGNPVEVCYATQEYGSVPAFYQIPAERTKPFGTVHAVLCAEEFVKEPFAVVNADDYYGVDGFVSINRCLHELKDGQACMVGYYLKNTVSENGTVTRGVCSQENGLLTKVTETFKIQPFPDGTIRDTATDANGVILDPDALVSMNFWGFLPGIFPQMRAYFDAFLRSLAPGELKAECLLPIMVDDLMRKGELSVRVLSTNATWFGITYPQDKPYVQQELKKLHDKGVYPPALLH